MFPSFIPSLSFPSPSHRYFHHRDSPIPRRKPDASFAEGHANKTHYKNFTKPMTKPGRSGPRTSRRRLSAVCLATARTNRRRGVRAHPACVREGGLGAAALRPCCIRRCRLSPRLRLRKGPVQASAPGPAPLRSERRPDRVRRAGDAGLAR